MLRSLRLLAAIASLLLAPVLAAQQGGSIRGIVVDARTLQPLPAATVMARTAADSSARPFGARTGSDGSFLLEHLPLGHEYLVEVTFLGYEAASIDSIRLTTSSPIHDIGRVTLVESSVELGGVNVREQRPEVRVMADKTVYSVEDNPTYTATNVSDLLGQVPGVYVDQDGEVTLKGSDDVTIMMNDRPLTMPAEQRNKFLQSLPASTVRDIEIRTNPGARFDAKSQGGIINIVTRRTMGDLLGGMVNAGTDTHWGGNGGANLYLNGDALSASLGGGIYSSPWSGASTSTQVNYRDSIEHRVEGSGSYDGSSTSWHVYGQADYKITSQDLASITFRLNNFNSGSNSLGASVFYDATDQIVRRSYDSSAPAEGDNGGSYHSGSVLLKHTFSEGHELKLDVGIDANGYRWNENENTTYFSGDGALDSSRSYEQRRLFERSSVDVISTLDYDNRLSDALTISLGARNESNMLDRDNELAKRQALVGDFIRDTLLSRSYKPRNTTYAGYANVAFRPSELLSMQGGLRLESATVTGEYSTGESIVERTYTNAFPSGSISLNPAESHSITLSYRRSVALPDIEALDPAVRRWSDRSESAGNPDLSPEFTNRFELSYSTYWDGGNMISGGTHYSTTSGSIEQTQTLTNGVTRSRPENFKGAYSIGVEASLSLKPVEWLGFHASGNLYRSVNRGSSIPGDLYTEGTGYNGSLSLNVDPYDGLTLSGSLFAWVPPRTGATRSGGFNFSSINVRQRLLDKKLTISLWLRDPFNAQRWEHEYHTPEFSSVSSSSNDSRYLGLSVSYSFGTTPRLEDHRQERTTRKGGGDSGSGAGGGEQVQ